MRRVMIFGFCLGPILIILPVQRLNADGVLSAQVVEEKSVYCINFISELRAQEPSVAQFPEIDGRQQRALDRLRSYSITHSDETTFIALEAASVRGKQDAASWVEISRKCYTDAQAGRISIEQMRNCGGQLRLIPQECTEAAFLPY